MERKGYFKDIRVFRYHAGEESACMTRRSDLNMCMDLNPLKLTAAKTPPEHFDEISRAVAKPAKYLK